MVCLSSGRFSIMAFKVVAKPRSRILSASSSTTKKGQGVIIISKRNSKFIFSCSKIFFHNNIMAYISLVNKIILRHLSNIP